MPSAGDIVLATDVSTIVSTQVGIVAIVTQTSNGTVTSGTTETRDAVLGNLTFTVAAAQASTRYRVTLSGRGLNASAIPSGVRYAINIRDGGASTPTATSTLVGVNFTVVPTATGSAGTQAQTYSTTYVPGSGTHTLSVFVVQSGGGSGTATPTGACEFYVEALGTH